MLSAELLSLSCNSSCKKELQLGNPLQLKDSFYDRDFSRTYYREGQHWKPFFSRKERLAGKAPVLLKCNTTAARAWHVKGHTDFLPKTFCHHFSPLQL